MFGCVQEESVIVTADEAVEVGQLGRDQAFFVPRSDVSILRLSSDVSLEQRRGPRTNDILGDAQEKLFQHWRWPLVRFYEIAPILSSDLSMTCHCCW